MNKIIFEKPLKWRVLPGQGGVSVATCDELGMVLQIDDDSPEQQVRQIMEALRLLYDDLEQDGQLEEFFAYHGVNVKIQKPQKRQEVQPDFEMFLRALNVDDKVLA